ncbi:P1 family peptidase [Sphingomonas colocasiae]|nr:P1 family peptidase [Sphingomonas colocasiae]
MMNILRLTAALAIGLAASAAAAQAPRARDLGVPFHGDPGPFNAITDVPGVEVGHSTIIQGDGELKRGDGPVRTGVTAILPRGKDSAVPVFGGWATANAAGEMTGTTWLEERGSFDGPVMITNTHSVGVVRDAAVKWLVDKKACCLFFTPVVAETWDGYLNDVDGFHVKPEHATEALATARSGRVTEGNVGGGTGMVCAGFKGGIGTSSRKVEIGGKSYTVGVLVQCNYGSRQLLRIGGAPVGQDLATRYLPCSDLPGAAPYKPARKCEPISRQPYEPEGSIIVVIATDAPLLPHQLKRVAKRPTQAIGRMGDISHNLSGDIFIAFSTANAEALNESAPGVQAISAISNSEITKIFEAAVDATEEAIVNSMIAAKTMTGRDGVTVYALPHDELRTILAKYGRTAKK